MCFSLSPLLLTVMILWTFSQNLLGTPSFAASKQNEKRAGALNPMFGSLQIALNDALPSLGKLEEWQKEIYQEEVLSQPNKFLKDYQTSGQSGRLKTEADLDILRNYLKFFGPDHLKKAQPNFLVHFQFDKTCKKCVDSASEIKTLILGRLKRRKIGVIQVAPKEAAATNFMDPAAIGKLVEMRKGSGSLICQWNQMPNDDSDTAHADEKRYSIRISLQVPDLISRDGMIEVSETDDFGETGRNLLTDYFTEMGAKVTERGELSSAQTLQSKYWIEISGLNDFKKYSLVKSALFQLFQSNQNGYQIKEKKIRRGSVTFLVSSNGDLETLKSMLGDLRVESGPVVLLRSAENKIEMEAK